MTKVAILNYHGSSLFELACAVELFALPRREFEHWYHTEVVSFAEGALASSANLALIGSRQVRSLAAYQMIIVPSWPVDREPDTKLCGRLIKAADRGSTLVSFCSGAFLLGHCGLLNGIQATTHWRYASQFKQNFPKVDYVDDVLYTIETNLATSAGSAAAIDLGLELIRRDMGAEKARMVARRLVMSPHRKGGQAQYIDKPAPGGRHHLSETLEWAQHHLAEVQSVTQLASKAAMSRRSFDRHFQALHGTTPKRWLNHQKIIRARELLETSDAPMETIANHSGFESAAVLRQHFRRQLGVSPRQYRHEFSSLTNHSN